MEKIVNGIVRAHATRRDREQHDVHGGEARNPDPGEIVASLVLGLGDGIGGKLGCVKAGGCQRIDEPGLPKRPVRL